MLRRTVDRLTQALRRAPWFALALAAAMLIWGLRAHAEPAYAESARVFLTEALQLPGNTEVEVSVGEPDQRLALAPCARTEPFVPAGAKLIGRTSLGVRCVEGANWTIYVPVRIRMFMEVMVAARPIARGQTVGIEDVRPERVDIAPLRGNAILASDWVDGRMSTRSLAPGEPVRRDALKAPSVVAAGDAVTVLAIGTGFAAQTSGKALSAGAEGETVQVAVTGGRVLTGVARAPRTVEVR